MGFGPVTVTANYATEDNAADTDSQYSVAVLYKMGKTQISAGFTEGTEDDKASGAAKGTSEVVAVGVQRSLGKGVALTGSIYNAEIKQPGVSKVDGFGLVGAILFKF